jgi:hypothetical protein
MTRDFPFKYATLLFPSENVNREGNSRLTLKFEKQGAAG